VLINLGCGDRYVEGGWINVDHAGSPHRKDVTLDLLADPLPWPTGSILHVYLGHVLEHLPYDGCLDLLKRLLPLVKPEGQILVVGPDCEVAQQMAEAGTLDVTLDSLKYGADRWHGDRHEWECTAGQVVDLLADAGWVDIQDVGIQNVAAFWPVADRRPIWQCAIGARSPQR
jgi:hypothetical protein